MTKMIGVIAVALVAALLVYLVLAQRSTIATLPQQNISPQAYVTDYLQANQPHLLLDVRTPEEFAGGHIAGAVNIPLQTLAQRLGEVPKDQPVILYCRSGNRSRQALNLLKQAGYTQLQDLGGIIDWQAQGLAVQ